MVAVVVVTFPELALVSMQVWAEHCKTPLFETQAYWAPKGHDAWQTSFAVS
jgi:hypothetical protein